MGNGVTHEEGEIVMWYLIVPMVVIPVLCIVTVVLCFIIFNKKYFEIQFEFARKLSTEIQDVRRFFLDTVRKRSLEDVCERCGAVDPIKTTIASSVHVKICTKCSNEWDGFIRKTKEFEDYIVSSSRIRGIQSGGLPIVAGKYDEVVKEELAKEKRAIDAMKRVIAKWLDEDTKPSETIGLGSHSKSEPVTDA